MADDTPKKLKTRSSVHGAVCLTLQKAPSEEMLEELKRRSEVKDVEMVPAVEDDKVMVRIYPTDPSSPPVDEVMHYFLEKGVALNAFAVENGHLDEVFRAITTSD